MGSDIPNIVKHKRLDLSDWVWHFTRRDNKPFEALKAIVDSGYIKGGTDSFCKDTAICFTEMPLTEAIRQSPALDQQSYARMSDYGIGFHKKWVFARGGLPVIYQPNEFRDKLPSEMRWRHCELDYSRRIDFTWQREWRVPGDRLDFTPEDGGIVVVRTEDEAMQLVYGTMYTDDVHDEVFVDIDWRYVTHELLRDAKSPSDVEIQIVERDA